MAQMTSLTHPGRRRRHNEDAVLALACGDVDVIAVADGVGGERGGEVASAEAIRIIEAKFTGSPRMPDPVAAMLAAIADANKTIHARGGEDARLTRMATTVVACVIRGIDAWVLNVGDSRAYRIGDDHVEQVTRDHSLIAEGLDDRLPAPGAKGAPARNVITRSVGTLPEVEVDVFGPMQLGPGDTLLICSDGLTDVVDDDELRLLVRGKPLAVGAQALVDAANSRGGPDNISVVLYRPGDDLTD